MRQLAGQANGVLVCVLRDGEKDIDTAQEAKPDLICRKLRLKLGESLLDIGCGRGAAWCYMPPSATA
jgi:cyclopropane fatty-acyl-phospholipid synthase-like methyltransferase